MSYAFGGRLDDDSYAVTYVDEDQGTAVTKGEINGVPFEGGGGGSSDFSTAEVTITNTTDMTIYMIVYSDDWNCSYISVIGDSDADTFSTILYNGKTLAFVTFASDSPEISTTGDVEYDEDSEGFYITGNGTITIS